MRRVLTVLSIVGIGTLALSWAGLPPLMLAEALTIYALGLAALVLLALSIGLLVAAIAVIVDKQDER